VGQWVWLRLLHRPMASLDVKSGGKLGPKFYGPYKIVERVGEVAFRLQLPAGAKIHDVFHVGLLKTSHGEPPSTPAAQPPIRHGQACLEPAAVLKCQLARGQHEVLMQWQGKVVADTSWMALNDFKHVYPTFHICGKQVGRDVMVGTTYHRRKNRTSGKQGTMPEVALG
jgi:hypothetical protein